MFTRLRSLLPLIALGLLVLVLGGCASQRPVVALPYQMPATGTAASSGSPRADLVVVLDHREDRTLDQFLSEPLVETVRKSLAAELVAHGNFSVVAQDPAAPFQIEVDLRELSWAVPNHAGMVKTAFWTSFLTGGLGGLAYGSTDTAVYGHAVVSVKLIERGTARTLLDQTFDAVHEEHMAKLKCDTLETRARMLALALKDVLGKALPAFPAGLKSGS